MPANKDLKRLVRARMRKTGEAYTTARAQITQTPRARTARAAGAARTAAVPPKSKDFAALAGMSDGGIVAVWFTAKGKSKSSVAVQHAKLSDKETAERMKAYWSERLEALGEVLAGA